MGRHSQVTRLVGSRTTSIPGQGTTDGHVDSRRHFRRVISITIGVVKRGNCCNVSLRSITGRVNVSRATIVRQIGDGRNLLVTIVRHRCSGISTIRQCLTRFESNNPHTKRQPEVPRILQTIIERGTTRPRVIGIFRVLGARTVSPIRPTCTCFTRHPTHVTHRFHRRG